MGDELKITGTVEGDKAEIVLEGALNTMSTPELAAHLEDFAAKASNIDLDIAALDCITDDGFELLLATSEALAAKGGALRLLHPNEVVADVIEMLDIAIETVA